MKNAVLQVADTGPLESLVEMLSSVGYKCWTIDQRGRNWLRNELKFDTVLDIDSLVSGYGYPRPMKLPEASVEGIVSCDLFVDVKAHRNGPALWDRAPHMKQRTVWYRINGGEPEIVPGCGDEVNPPCPVITPNQWYKDTKRFTKKSYVMWPPFVRASNYGPRILPRHPNQYDPPIALIHNFHGWGYGSMTAALHMLGVMIYGVRSPNGMIRHENVVTMLSNAIALVHPKSNDAPGYAIYEAMASGCPVICTRRLIWRCKMEDLLIPNETCLVFDQPTHETLNPSQVDECAREIESHLLRLRDIGENQRIANNAYRRLRDVTWSKTNQQDVKSFANFLKQHCGQ